MGVNRDNFNQGRAHWATPGSNESMSAPKRRRGGKRQPSMAAMQPAQGQRRERGNGGIALMGASLVAIFGVTTYVGLQLREDSTGGLRIGSEAPVNQAPPDGRFDPVGGSGSGQEVTPTVQPQQPVAEQEIEEPSQPETGNSDQLPNPMIYSDPSGMTGDWQVVCDGEEKIITIQDQDVAGEYEITQLTNITGEPWNQGSPPPNNPDEVLWQQVQETRVNVDDTHYTLTVRLGCTGLADF